MEKFKFWSTLQGNAFLYGKNRKSSTKNALSIIFCISAAIIFSLLIATSLGYDPFKLLGDLFSKGFINYSELFWNISILGISGLSFSFAFKAGIFNIGIPGQLLAGGLMMLVITNAIDKTGIKLPTGLGPIVAILIAVVFASLVAGIISLLRIYLNVNDVVSSILLNWIIFFLARMVIYKFYNPNPNEVFAQSISIPEQFRLVIPEMGGWIPSLIIFGSLVVIISVIWKYTKFGHKIIAVGFNPDASLYNGYNVKTIRILTMVISGAIAGILAVVLYTSGQTPAIPMTKDNDALPAVGFNGIAIGLIAMSNPIAIVPVAFIIGLFNSSSPFLEVPPSFSQLIIGLVILGATTFVILLNYKPWLWFKRQIYGFRSIEEYQDYENKLEVLISKYHLLLSESENTDEVKKLKADFISERSEIKNNFKKHMLILRATQTFFPNIEVDNVIKVKNGKLNQQYLRFENKSTKKVNKRKQNVEIQINKTVNVFNKINTKYNLMFLKDLLKNIKYLSEKKLVGLLVLLDKTKNEKFDIFMKSIKENQNLIDSNEKLKEKINILIIKNTTKKNELQLAGSLELLNKQIKNKNDFEKLTRKNFYYLSFIEKMILKSFYNKYLKQTDITISKQILISEIKQVSKNDTTVNERKILISTHKNVYAKITNLRMKISQINVQQNIANRNNTKSQYQLDVWTNKNIIETKKFYKWKAKLFGDLNKQYNKYVVKAQKIELPKKEKELLLTWLSNSYNEAQELKNKEGEQ